MDKFCQNCGAELHEGGDVCVKCGTPINYHSRKCPRCGSTNVSFQRETVGTIGGSHTSISKGHGYL